MAHLPEVSAIRIASSVTPIVSVWLDFHDFTQTRPLQISTRGMKNKDAPPLATLASDGNCLANFVKILLACLQRVNPLERQSAEQHSSN